MTSSSPKKTIEDTYADDDWFDIDQYKKAAQVAYDFSLNKRNCIRSCSSSKQDPGCRCHDDLRRTSDVADAF